MEDGAYRKHARIHAPSAPGFLRCFRPMWYNCMSRLQRFVDYSVQVGGPLYIILAVILISCVIYLLFTAILPGIYQFYSIHWILHTAVASWLTFNVFFNYYNCVCTDPGTPSNVDLAPDSQIIGRREVSESNFSAMIRWCKRCQKPKPPLTHHCHICHRCILKMDHHCRILLLYLWAGCGYAMYMASLLLFAQNDQEDSRVLFTFILALAVFGSLSCLVGWHLYLIMSAQTTIEFHTNCRRRKEARLRGEVWGNEFDLGMFQNFRNVFDRGGSGWWWLMVLLPIRCAPKGDGMHFVSRHMSCQPARVIGLHTPATNSSSVPIPDDAISKREYICKKQASTAHVSLSSVDIV
ncbi:hypothetical protein O6H91_13G031700 [Diphasiastrum complanatum]|uniref:Uncharacterized protein n=1 Tax=Diphasiastrum complanatum TaxID=34168 RepID=A0ACC2BTJ4_DIPCM|nr:hypothetical protein O6H91_13G031700 [Diphasiastrum complanatum]